jgi:hypothetical protein
MWNQHFNSLRFCPKIRNKKYLIKIEASFLIQDARAWSHMAGCAFDLTGKVSPPPKTRHNTVVTWLHRTSISFWNWRYDTLLGTRLGSIQEMSVEVTPATRLTGVYLQQSLEAVMVVTWNNFILLRKIWFFGIMWNSILCKWPVPWIWRLSSGKNSSQSQSHIATDGQSVSKSSWPDIYYCLTVTVLFLWGALSDERTGLSFVYAAGPCQRSLSRVRVPWYSRPHFTVSDLRLPFSSPPTTRRVTVEVFDPASTRVSGEN